MSIGALTIPTISSITEPTKFRVASWTAASKVITNFGLMSNIQYPGGRGTLFANGLDDMC